MLLLGTTKIPQFLVTTLHTVSSYYYAICISIIVLQPLTSTIAKPIQLLIGMVMIVYMGSVDISLCTSDMLATHTSTSPKSAV